MFDRTHLLGIVSGTRKGVVAGLARGILWMLIPVYRMAVEIRNRRFDRNPKTVHQVSKPVISIGNLTTGGTGKTPLVIWISEFFLGCRRQPAILSRGYGSQGDEPNDEAREIRHWYPDLVQLQHPDRVAIARQADHNPAIDVLILDDGFQHRRLGRDLDIVMVDATNPFGYGYLLPRGLLREPPANIGRADQVVISRCELATTSQIEQTRRAIEACAPGLPIATAATQPRHLSSASGKKTTLQELAGKSVYAFCAIGNPAGFFQLLESLDAKLVGQRSFPDHHLYRPADLDAVGKASGEAQAEMIVCTHKDLVKLTPDELQGLPLYALIAGLEFTSGREQLEQRLNRLVESSGKEEPAGEPCS